MVDKSVIRDRLQTNEVWVTSSRTELFGTVDSDKIRYVVGIFVNGDLAGTRNVVIEKKRNTTYTSKFHINVSPAEHKQLPQGGYSIEDPLLIIEGGSALYAHNDAPAGSSQAITVIYWDDRVI
jgi:hypothetical protein